MMIAAFDVHYLQDGGALAAAVLFSDYSDSEPAALYEQFITAAADYIPGEFYRRELPCILRLLKKIDKAVDVMIVDSYVMLRNRPGLGQQLYEAFDGKIPVIGVAKSKFEGSSGSEVFRGGSIRPLYVTAAGMEQKMAAEKIRMMHGAHRVPTLLKRVDLLARENVGKGL